MKWHVCDLCRLPGAPRDCKHERTSKSFSDAPYEYCEDCGATRRVKP